MGERESMLIKDEKESTQTRFISFKGEFNRYDLAIISSDLLAPDKLVVNLNADNYIKLNPETLEQDGYLKHHLHITDIVADELRDFLRDSLEFDK